MVKLFNRDSLSDLNRVQNCTSVRIQIQDYQRIIQTKNHTICKLLTQYSSYFKLFIKTNTCRRMRGRHDPKKIVVMGDSAYDDKRIENIIKDKKWSFVMSLKKKRSVKSEHEFNFKPKSHGWCGVDIFFKNHRRLKPGASAPGFCCGCNL
ncbi:MAG: hypothetical protein HQK75_12735 [Candidatus Magnetomorum sp.]|nr:hypothetical protein [Candidatus Magnetomorum sp.]